MPPIELKKILSPLTGLLVEPNPELYAKTKSRERNAWTLPSCFSTKKRPEIVKFDAAGAIGIYYTTKVGKQLCLYAMLVS